MAISKARRTGKASMVPVLLNGNAHQQLQRRSAETGLSKPVLLARLFQFFCEQDRTIQWRMMAPPSESYDRETVRMMLGKRGK